MTINIKIKIVLTIFLFLILFFLFQIKNVEKTSNIIFISDGFSRENKKFWVGGEYKIKLKNINDSKDQKVFFSVKDNKKVEFYKDHLIMKSSGKECLIASYNKNNYRICFNIYETPKLNFREQNPIKIETNTTKILNLDKGDYPESNLKYKSDHPDIIKVNNKGKITAIRPGSAIITVSGLDNVSTKIKIISISNTGLLSKYVLKKLNASHYQNVMIVAHPDDESLWGGANLIKDNYFVVCLTNGYNLKRANDFRTILKFTKNGGIILNYPDTQDNIRDDWIYVGKGILNDLSLILNYSNWKKIVTHGPEGTTGHYHHKKTYRFVLETVKKFNKLNNLYYFAKFYKKNEMPKSLPRISDKELEYKIKEVSIYKSVNKYIYKLWYHMLPFEKLIPASNLEIT